MIMSQSAISQVRRCKRLSSVSSQQEPDRNCDKLEEIMKSESYPKKSFTSRILGNGRDKPEYSTSLNYFKAASNMRTDGAPKTKGGNVGIRRSEEDILKKSASTGSFISKNTNSTLSADPGPDQDPRKYVPAGLENLGNSKCLEPCRNCDKLEENMKSESFPKKSFTSRILGNGRDKPEYSTTLNYFKAASNMRTDGAPKTKGGNVGIRRSEEDILKKSASTGSLISKDTNSTLSADPVPDQDPQKYVPAGLENLGNSCYLNAILQCIQSTTLLRNYCLEKKYEASLQKSGKTGGDLFPALTYVLAKMQSTAGGTVPASTIQKFKSAFSKVVPTYAGNLQQDAFEFMDYLLDLLHEETKTCLQVSEPNRRISVLNLTSPIEENFAQNPSAPPQHSDEIKENTSSRSERPSLSEADRTVAKATKRSIIRRIVHRLRHRSRVSSKTRRSKRAEGASEKGGHFGSTEVIAQEKSFLKDTFLGRYQTRLRCSCCQNVTTRNELFWTLALCVPEEKAQEAPTKDSEVSPSGEKPSPSTEKPPHPKGSKVELDTLSRKVSSCSQPQIKGQAKEEPDPPTQKVSTDKPTHPKGPKTELDVPSRKISTASAPPTNSHGKYQPDPPASKMSTDKPPYSNSLMKAYSDTSARKISKATAPPTKSHAKAEPDTPSRKVSTDKPPHPKDHAKADSETSSRKTSTVNTKGHKTDSDTRTRKLSTMNSVVSDSSTPTAASTISAPTVSLKDCLETFTKKEDLDGDDKPFCERCKKHTKTQLQILFSDLPEILILQFLRFDSSNSHNKRRNLIDFDFELDLAKYTTKGLDDSTLPRQTGEETRLSAGAGAAAASSPDHEHELVLHRKYSCNPTAPLRRPNRYSMVGSLPSLPSMPVPRSSHSSNNLNCASGSTSAGLTPCTSSHQLTAESCTSLANIDEDTPLHDESLENTHYRLYGVVYHRGGTERGHYTAKCLVRPPLTKEESWYSFDDDHVSEITDLAEIVQPSAYILFYEKVTEPQSPADNDVKIQIGADAPDSRTPQPPKRK